MTYVKDEMLNLAARMTDMSEDLISESDIRVGAAATPKRERSGRFSAFMNHPAMVAVLCAVVSLSVLVAIVMAGRGGPLEPPFQETTPSGRPPAQSEDVSQADVYLTYIYGSKEIFLVPSRFMVWDETYDANGNVLSGDGWGFSGDEGQLAELKLKTVTDATNFTVYLKGVRTLQSISVYDEAMNEITRLSPGQTTGDMKAGMYYIAFRIVTRDGELSDGHDYAFAVRLTRDVTSLKVSLRQECETELGYEAIEYTYDYTLTVQEPVVAGNIRYLDIYMTANEPGKILGGYYGYRLYRLEGEEEILVHDYDVGAVGLAYPDSPYDYATLEVGVSFVYVKHILAERGESLKTGTYRVEFGNQSVEFELYDASREGPVENPLHHAASPVHITVDTTGSILSSSYMERDYHRAEDMEKIMEALSSLTMENAPMNAQVPNDGMEIDVTFENSTVVDISIRGEYLSVDESPLYIVPEEEMSALRDLIESTLD